MSSQAGVWFFDRRPMEGSADAVRDGLQPLAERGVTLLTENGLAMAHGGCPVWTGEETADLPRHSPSGMVMTWDGRLDNRDDLTLRLHGRLAGDTSDAAIAMEAFERWGSAGLRALIGDWSLVALDSARRRLSLARDYMGVRPLYYYVDDRCVMWSSSLGELATRSGRVDELDEIFVARFMALRLSTDVTPYRGIRAVPTATCVSISVERIETRQRFWQPEPSIIRYRDKSEHEEHLRSLWTEAVATRLRTEDRVCAELSGGLDSSSVVCMAAALINAGRVPARGLQPVSHVTLHSPEGDERRFIAEVETRTGVISHVIGVEEHLALRCDYDWVTPFAPEGVQVASVRHACECGARVMLSGRLGDLVMGCSVDNSVAVFDDLNDGRIACALAKIRLWSRASRKPFAELVWALWQQKLRTVSTMNDRRPLNKSQQAGFDLLTPRLRVLASQSSVSMPSGIDLPLSTRSLAASVADTSVTARLEVLNEDAGVTFTYPFAHRPLIDFVMAIPGEELSSPGELRSLMRRAFAGFVPPRVLNRVSKGYYPPAIARATRLLATSLRPVQHVEAVRRGWLDAGRLETAVRVLIEGGGSTSGEVERVLRLERWLTSRDRRAPAATPIRKEVRTNAELFIA